MVSGRRAVALKAVILFQKCAWDLQTLVSHISVQLSSFDRKPGGVFCSQEISSPFVTDWSHVGWQTAQRVKGGEVGERVAVSSGRCSCPWTGAAVHLRDGGLRALSRPTSAPVWLQGGVRQPQTSQLWPPASGSSGTTSRMTSSQTQTSQVQLCVQASLGDCCWYSKLI